MKPEAIFTDKGYDMAVAVRLDAINRQLLKLGDFGAIDYTLYIEADVDADDNWVYSLKSRPQEILLDPTTGRPKKPTLIGEYRPFFEATPGNSRTIMLSVVFRSGQIWAPGASGSGLCWDDIGDHFKNIISVDASMAMLSPRSGLCHSFDITGKVFNIWLAAFAGTGSFLFGYDAGVMTDVIGSPNFLNYFNTTDTSAIIGAINSFNGGAVFDSLMGGLTMGHFGRKMTIQIGALICLSK
ncbi:uncharacterized protein BP5553_05686 [Venustampulla echinocandica]|uniref:Major facilitator superfamily (MFS) profile domain-containing protein n=1 Tax=Venustampulla echinocandica TaxID=2656787 RepID=A0A370TLD3_9HELO|nr:uncharacterized protein BP5553_05686 [Venustampulla echinocandica]RDL36334.1 hypothetical protein BP5553_05686 [Venustampulla echinocandica]